jgi:GNAT superfamily N-acetyltransferase
MFSPTPRLQDLPIEGPAQLVEAPDVWASALRGIRAAQDAGNITRDRSDPDGEEWILWIGPRAAPLAFAIFYDVGLERTWLDFLYVAPPARRSGLATRLIERVSEKSKDLGFRRLLLGTAIGNAPMQALAGKLGFGQVAINFGKGL